jgi:hypothetical protein
MSTIFDTVRPQGAKSGQYSQRVYGINEPSNKSEKML